MTDLEPKAIFGTYHMSKRDQRPLWVDVSSYLSQFPSVKEWLAYSPWPLYRLCDPVAPHWGFLVNRPSQKRRKRGRWWLLWWWFGFVSFSWFQGNTIWGERKRFFCDSVKIFFWSFCAVFADLARFLNAVLCKCLIINDLRPAARPGSISAWLLTTYVIAACSPWLCRCRPRAQAMSRCWGARDYDKEAKGVSFWIPARLWFSLWHHANNRTRLWLGLYSLAWMYSSSGSIASIFSMRSFSNS